MGKIINVQALYDYEVRRMYNNSDEVQDCAWKLYFGLKSKNADKRVVQYKDATGELQTMFVRDFSERAKAWAAFITCTIIRCPISDPEGRLQQHFGMKESIINTLYDVEMIKVYSMGSAQLEVVDLDEVMKKYLKVK